MLDAANRVRLYSKALEMIATGMYDNVDTYVFDYDKECYRSGEGYTLNGLHWGYPDSLVAVLTGEFADHNSDGGWYFATWVTSDLQKDERYGGNDRYQIVKFHEIRAAIELGIRQKLDKARSSK